jgi:hypothetical protein
VLVFGYGGRFDMGFGLLKEGAEHVILCDKYAPPDDPHNRRLYGAEDKVFLRRLKSGWRPRPEWMTLLEDDIRDLRVSARGDIEPVDFVLSSSVYEHVDDVEGITRALAALTKPDGLHIHFVDLARSLLQISFRDADDSPKSRGRIG